jgi:hypothetical protein
VCVCVCRSRTLPHSLELKQVNVSNRVVVGGDTDALSAAIRVETYQVRSVSRQHLA